MPETNRQLTTMTTSASPTFHLFPSFPLEIRLIIWRHCLPSRVVELDYISNELWDWDAGEPPPCRKCSAPTTRANNNCSPLIARVCRESRTVALESGGPQPFPSPVLHPDTKPFANYMAFKVGSWLDTARDVVHLNWCPEEDDEWDTYSWGNPLRCLAWWADRTRSRVPSFSLAMLQSHQIRSNLEPGFNPDEPNTGFRWTRPELARLIRTRQEWMVTVAPPVVVHADAKDAAGLFGPLGDAPVQLVDLDDGATLDRMFSLGATTRPEGNLDLWRMDLKSSLDFVFRPSEPPPPHLRPMLMFRLCYGGCI